MRKLEALETTEPVPVNQISPNQFLTPGCTYCQVINHVFEECPIFHAQQICPELMNAASARLNNNLITHIYYIILYYIPYLSCNKSAKFLILNVYFAEEIMRRKRIKSNKYQLNSDLTRSIWLEEDDPKSSWLNLTFSESGG